MSNEQVEPIVLIRANDPDKKPVLYACGKCGRVTSPKTFACNEVMAHETARKMAAECYSCKTHEICQYCGDQCSKPRTACAPCRRKRKLEAATLVDGRGMEECFAFDGDQFYRSPDEAAEDGQEYVVAANFIRYQIDEERLWESVLDGHHDDSDMGELVGVEKVSEAIEAFNKAQTGGSYEPDPKRIASLAFLDAQ